MQSTNLIACLVSPWHAIRLTLYLNHMRLAKMRVTLPEYTSSTAFDELLDAARQPRAAARPLFDYLATLDTDELAARREAVDATIMAMGITFTIYSEAGNIDRAWPFDPIPRVMARSEWDGIEAGLKQRLRALNLFINDLYNEQRIIKDGVFPAAVLAGSSNFRPQCVGQSGKAPS